MRTEPATPGTTSVLHRPDAHSALRVSTASVVWTLASSAVAVTIGIHSHATVLVAFGAVGLVDAIGSIALVHHFRHGLQHDRLSDDLEQLAHRVVLIGLLVVGCAAVAGGMARLLLDQSGKSSDSGAALAGVSLIVLILLSARKQQVARRIGSSALLSDGHLSAVGATLAAVTLVGTAATSWLGWSWADAAATSLVGGVAALLAVSTWRSEGRD